LTPKQVLALIERVSRALCNLGSVVTTERALQDRVRERLVALGVTFVEEHPLEKLGRLDFLVEARLVLELKIDGSAAAIIRQLDRYLAGEFDGALVVTTKRQHLVLPSMIRGKPVRAVWVGSL
jgi:hypothetical protein